ncbi:MAG TPA: Fe-only nitrogenase accessory protein AnfO [Candidatus Sulfotelmatobacter sp.]|jgi:Fe-only nitrogenase accessory protein AnfO|nr:Fe-only nitrogenase accessory protein AnfO [Candidatus Sulfotelmatobacter sp.]
MKIAVHVDNSNRIARFSPEGKVRLYERAGYGWMIADEIPFPIGTDLSLGDIKAGLSGLVARLPGCRTFLSGEVRGLIYSLMQEEYGFRVWKSAGDPESQLDDIIQRDAELAVQREREAAEQAFAAVFSSPSGGCGGGCSGGGGGTSRKRSAEALRAVRSLTERVEGDHHRIDLSAILAKYKSANSMDVLTPLMEGPLLHEAGFGKLEILCDHLPRWFSGKLEELGLLAEIETTSQGVRAMVFPNREKELRHD